MSDQRTIVHLDLDSFFVSVERLKNPQLVGKPVLVGSDSDRGVVASCSYEARRFGVRSAMPMRTAKQLCPEAIILRGDSGAYMRKSDEVTEIIRERVPLFEKTSVDEFYVDLTGTERFFGALKLASELRQYIAKETGLPNSFGLSVNKTVSKVATNTAKPNGQREVERGTEKPFLAPMPIESIPGVGGKTAHLLRSMGVSRCTRRSGGAPRPRPFSSMLQAAGPGLFIRIRPRACRPARCGPARCARSSRAPPCVRRRRCGPAAARPMTGRPRSRW